MPGYRKDASNECIQTNIKVDNTNDCGSAKTDDVSPFNCLDDRNPPLDTRFCTEDGLCRTDKCPELWRIKTTREKDCALNGDKSCGPSDSTLAVDCANKYDGYCNNGICQNYTPYKCNGVELDCTSYDTCAIESGAFVCL